MMQEEFAKKQKKIFAPSRADAEIALQNLRLGARAEFFTRQVANSGAPEPLFSRQKTILARQNGSLAPKENNPTN